ncbi:MAG: TOBE domain-containing protein, partial [Ktedonobacteraceae bacterium]|nr:TOBE domain-containing protein [Ktedonobacteraceae bacterium]
RAMVLQPQLLLLDEPLSALDVQTRREVRQELRRILAEAGITTVMVTHHYFEALLFGHQILVLDDGRVIQQGDQRDLREYPRSSYVAELVGVNFFSGRIRSFEDGVLCVMELRDERRPVEIVATLKGEGEGERPAVGGEAFVVIEPRHVTLHTDAPGGSARNVLRGRVMHIVDVPDAGGMVRVSLALDDSLQPLTAEISGASVARLGLREEMVVYATFKVGEASAYT